jgi:hypothetical protein
MFKFEPAVVSETLDLKQFGSYVIPRIKMVPDEKGRYVEVDRVKHAVTVLIDFIEELQDENERLKKLLDRS